MIIDLLLIIVHFLEAKGANIETVIRLDDAKSTKINKTSVGADSDILKLVDAHDNQYVLAKGKDSTVPHEDYHLIQVNLNTTKPQYN